MNFQSVKTLRFDEEQLEMQKMVSHHPVEYHFPYF